MAKDHVSLPTNAAELDEFVAEIVEQFGLPGGDQVYGEIATAIMHLESKTELRHSYFADYAFRGLAKRAAYEWLLAKDAEAKAKVIPDANGSKPVQNT